MWKYYKNNLLIIADIIAIVFCDRLIYLRYFSVAMITIVYLYLINQRVIKNEIVSICSRYDFNYNLLSNDKNVFRGDRAVGVIDNYCNMFIAMQGKVIVCSYNNFGLNIGEIVIRDDKIYTIRKVNNIYQFDNSTVEIAFERDKETQVFNNMTLGDMLVINRHIYVDYTLMCDGGKIIVNKLENNRTHIEIKIEKSSCALFFNYKNVIFNFAIYKLRAKDISLDLAIKENNFALYNGELLPFNNIRYLRNYNGSAYTGQEGYNNILLFNQNVIYPTNVYISNNTIQIIVQNELIEIEQRDDYIVVDNNSEILVQISEYKKWFKNKQANTNIYVKDLAKAKNLQKEIYSQVALYEIKYEDANINTLWQYIGRDEDYISMLMVLRLMLYFDNKKENILSLYFKSIGKCLYKQLFVCATTLEYIKTSERYELFDITISGYTLNQLVYKISDKASEICLKKTNYDLALKTLYLINTYLDLINTVDNKLDLIEIKQAIISKYRIIKDINFSRVLLTNVGIQNCGNDYNLVVDKIINEGKMNQYVASLILYDYFVNVLGVKRKNNQIKILPMLKINDNKTIIAKINNSLLNINLIKNKEQKVIINGDISHTDTIKLDENKEKYVEIYY